MSNRSDNQSRSALVTGASRGIGRAIAEALAAECTRLYITCKDSGDVLNELAEHLSAQHGIPVTPLVFDVADAKAVESAFAHIPSLDLVICNAGVACYSLLQDTSVDDWHRVTETNLSGTFHILKCAVPLLLHSENGRILTVSSVWGSAGAAMECAYSASKGGLDALTRSLAAELAPSGIPVNAIACGVIDTQMNRAHLDAEELEALRETIPAGRFGTPEEVAAFALLLLRAPTYLTGQVIRFDGGFKL